ncbi:hypothetical protein E4U41_006868 [Claviceps citrina]|nr:hypothetical protein E4U41_006868 [Claviceps citrina]
MNYLKASLTMLTPSQRACFETGRARGVAASASSSLMRSKSSAYGRMFPNRLMETIVTHLSLGDNKNGRQLHWAEDRTISIMEARRAQGFPDEEVLLGSPQSQYKIVGNSVSRQVALALGAVIRDAWVDSHFGTDETHMVGRLQGRKMRNAEDKHARGGGGAAAAAKSNAVADGDGDADANDDGNGHGEDPAVTADQTNTLLTRLDAARTRTKSCPGNVQHGSDARQESLKRRRRRSTDALPHCPMMDAPLRKRSRD